MTLNLFTQYGAFRLLELVNDKLESLAERFHVSTGLAFIAGILMMLAIGLAGIYLVKVIVSLPLAVSGYWFGYVLFVTLFHAVKEGTEAPAWGRILFGVLFALTFFFFAWKRSTYGFYAALFVIAFYLVEHYLDCKLWMTLLAAAAIALIGMYFLKAAVIAATGFGAGIFTVSFLSQLLPTVNAFQLDRDHMNSLIVAVCFGMVFIIVQMISSRRYRLK